MQVTDRLLAGTGGGAAWGGMEEDRDLERIFISMRGEKLPLLTEIPPPPGMLVAR